MKTLNFLLVLFAGFGVLVLISACTSVQGSEEDSIEEGWGPNSGDTLIVNPELLEQVNQQHEKKVEIKANYRVVSWIKADCSSCVLKLKRWAEFNESSLLTGDFEVYPIAQASSKDLLLYTIEDIFDYQYPIYYDSTNHFFKQNQLTEDPHYQTFLLDQNNRVLAIGDPTLAEDMFDLYKRIINEE